MDKKFETEKVFEGKIFKIMYSGECIEVYSKARIPFDNIKSIDILEFKKILLLAIQQFLYKPSYILFARYGTTDKTKVFCDLENVLFYNIGTANFSGLAKEGIVFSQVSEFEIRNKREMLGISDEYAHYYEYLLLPIRKDTELSNMIVSWDAIDFCKCKALDPADVWKSIHLSEKTFSITERINYQTGDMFAINLILEKPKRVDFNITTAMKPLLDGLICALHGACDYDEKSAKMYSDILDCPVEWIYNNNLNVLGIREYIQKYPRARKGIKWNPADDMCKAVNIQIIEGDAWRLQGTITKIFPCCPNCGKTKISRLIYGMPAMSVELEKQLHEGIIALAGCCVDDYIPKYRCQCCQTEF